MLNREEKINILMAQDIVGIKKDFEFEDYSFVCSILQGEGWTQYNLLSKNQLDAEFEDRWGDIENNIEVLKLAQKLNGKEMDIPFFVDND